MLFFDVGVVKAGEAKIVANPLVRPLYQIVRYFSGCIDDGVQRSVRDEVAAVCEYGSVLEERSRQIVQNLLSPSCALTSGDTYDSTVEETTAYVQSHEIVARLDELFIFEPTHVEQCFHRT